MTSKRNRLATLERVVDVELDARARRALGLGDGPVNWVEVAREYQDICERMAAIQRRLPPSRAREGGLTGIEPEVRVLAQDLCLDFDELIAEAERIMSHGGADLKTERWLLAHL
jgi:hypothetical protein